MDELKTFVVGIPIGGALEIEIEAADEDAAIAEAWRVFNNEGEDAFDLQMEISEDTYVEEIS